MRIASALMVAFASCGGAETGDGPSDAWWRPAPTATWHIQLSGETDTSVDADVYDVDLYDVPDATLAAIKARAKLICYFSAGSHEDWRADAAEFPPATIGKELDGWPGERWLDVRSPEVRAVLARRLDVAVQRGCDAVDPDNINGHDNDTGFDLTRADALAFVRWLAAEGHARGLGVGLKNGGDLAAEVADALDFEVNEECLSYGECDALQPFVAAGRAVFHIEYVDDQVDGPAALATVCADPSRAAFRTVVKTWDLSAWRLDCP